MLFPPTHLRKQAKRNFFFHVLVRRGTQDDMQGCMGQHSGLFYAHGRMGYVQGHIRQ